MEGHTFVFRSSDIRRVKITCRCSTESVAEVPQQLAKGYVLHPCPKCRAVFEVHQVENGKWEIKRLQGTLDDMAFQLGVESSTSTEKNKKEN